MMNDADASQGADQLCRFVIENCGVRGEHVRLGSSWRELHTKTDYQPAVLELLGQTVSAVALLAATVKFDGALTLQATGDGALRLLVVEASGERTFRGLARLRQSAPENPGADILLGNGRIALTIDPGEGKDRYQGIVDFAGGPLSEVLERYFERSEQIPTRIWLAANEHQVAGLMLQHLPEKGIQLESGDLGSLDEDDGWQRCVTLAETLADEELLGLESAALLRRLFHQERVRLFDPEPWAFRCRCSLDRVKTMLRGLGKPEVDDILAEQGKVGVTCDFCNASYEFDAVDAEQIFAGGDAAAPDRVM